MKPAFSKLGWCTDIHFGEKGNDRKHNEWCLEYIDWFLSVTDDCDTLVFGGDWHHVPSNVGSETLKYSYEATRRLFKSGKKLFFVLGNHDLMLKNSRSTFSIPWLESFPNIEIVNEIKQVGDTLLVPWLVPGDDLSLIRQTNARYVMGHFEFGGFAMNESYLMPHVDGHLAAEEIEGPEYVFAGHFHGRQFKTMKSGLNVHYTGNCFPHDFSDEGDTNRGCMILKNGSAPEYKNWPNMPTYLSVKLSQLDESLSNVNDRTTIKVIQDIDLSVSERDTLRSMMLEDIKVNSIKIETLPKQGESDIQYQAENETISEAVIRYLEQIKEPDLNNGKLVDIYKKA